MMTAARFHSILTTGDEHGNILTTVELERPGAGSFSGSLVPPAEPIRITAHVARRLLREVVALHGRHHKSPAAYVLDRCPACLVGCALYQAGLTEDELAAMDTLRPNRIGGVELPARVRMTTLARRVFAAAQMKQDHGLPWGTALNAALSVKVVPVIKWRQAVAA